MRNHIRAATYLVDLLENKFEILGWRFGLDPILGLIPGIGDLLGMLISSYLVWVGWKMNIPRVKIWEMVWNLVIDLVIGSLPVVGDVLDFVYKANVKNLRILKEFEEGEVIEPIRIR